MTVEPGFRQRPHVLGLVTLVGRLLQERVAALLADADLTYSQAVTLVRLWRSEIGEMRQSDLIDSLAVSRAAGTQVLNDLERRGMVTRIPDADDARMQVIRLTAEGRSIEPHIAQIFDRAEAETVELLDDAERADLMRSLGRMLESVRRHRGAT